ncbi:hypothetical protein NM688_g7823 [Phlebia brevispora]|uniref:Uncharacterized protein n=1 Tax=Phlebia brevispora TaxID=194682 RepID=A0ACC1S0W0_9APHY|nr:hypothetical protein NM688_g7823 [Phlebia brevispora]
MRRTGPPRLNRLPQRLDYTLIPAPLDLSGPIVDEKSPLPAIIVTPSSPSGETDFCIAFLAPQPKPTLRERVSTALAKVPKFSFHRRLPSEIQLPINKSEYEAPPSSQWSFKARARTAILLTILVFIMACHLILHSMITVHPRLDFGSSSDEDILASLASGPLDGLDSSAHNTADANVAGWFNLHSIWAPLPITDGKRAMRFVVTDGELVEPQNSE